MREVAAQVETISDYLSSQGIQRCPGERALKPNYAAAQLKSITVKFVSIPNMLGDSAHCLKIVR